jgi:adenosylcobyric acid synthase
MVQATGSNAGKSTLVAGLARAYVRRGLRVAPFKPQNMSNNAAITADGGEIGRAQAMQAQAARMAPTVHMNPVLLKPESDTGAQVVIQGRVAGLLRAGDYTSKKASLLPRVLESFSILEERADLILIEGAGSPAEINLRAGDIANMGFAEAADVPVVLAGDIDRGGVIASLVGTHVVLDDAERNRIKGFLINKFRGDVSLFDEGLTEITKRTGWPTLGVLPWLPAAAWLPAEDAVDLDRPTGGDGALTVAVPMLSRIANFDDLDPLGMEPGVRLIFVRPGTPIPAGADVIVLPGTKSTIADLAFVREQGWDVDIRAHARRGGHVLGLCGGYQMLGTAIDDPDGVDGTPGRVDGLGLLRIDTVMAGDKTTTLATGAHVASGTPISGYEIHMGRTAGIDCGRPMVTLSGSRPDGATSPDGRIQGTYLHGLFADDDFRRAWLAGLGVASGVSYHRQVESALDALADHVEAHLDLDAMLAIAESR